MNALSKTVLAAVVLAAPVAAQTAVPALDDDWWGHALFAGSQLVGWTLLAQVCLELRDRTGAGSSRAARVGAAFVLAACGLQLLFALAYAGSVAMSGEPGNAVFVPFGLGFLSLTVGGITWGAALRRSSAQPSAGTALITVAALGLVAVGVEADPWHDVALLGSYLAWIGVGQAVSASAAERAPAEVSR